MRPEELERIRTSDDAQTAAFNVAFDNASRGEPNSNPFIKGGELHSHYEMGYWVGESMQEGVEQ